MISPTSTASGAKYNKLLSGTLKGKGDVFAAAAAKEGVDPNLLMAISMHETGNGTNVGSKSKNNVGGMMKKGGGQQSFGSIDEGIYALASLLRRGYISQGLTSIEQIQKKYAPVGAGNDPRGLNNYWVTGVTKYYNMLSK